MMRKAVLCSSLVVSSMIANAADLLNDFKPSTLRSDYGVTNEVEFSTPFVELESRALAHHVPAAMKSFRMSEPVWVIAYKSWIIDPKGNEPRENYLCHTFLADQTVDQHSENELKGIYSDAFTPEIVLPPGFGVRLTPDDPLHWMPMFNNRGDDPVPCLAVVAL